MSFEERADDLAANVASLGYDLDGLIAEGKLAIDYVRVERSEIEETGEYDLEGLFVRLGYAIDKVGAKRVVLDTLEALFSGLGDGAVLRAELRRLFDWLKESGVTAVITAERGEGQLTRHGIEEYVSDCVIVLDNRVEDQITTRRLRVREVPRLGARHQRISVPDRRRRASASCRSPRRGCSTPSPTRSCRRASPASTRCWGRAAIIAGSSVLVSGTSGTGKTIFARQLRRRRLQARRARDLLLVRGDRRTRSSATCARSASTCRRMSMRGLLLLRGGAAEPVRAGDAPDADEPHDRAIPARPSWSSTRSPRCAGRRRRSTPCCCGWSTCSRAGHHGRVHQPARTARERGRRPRPVLADGHLDRAASRRGQRRAQPVLYVLKSRGMSHSNQVREFQMSASGVT